jgi:hypothetical protein
MKAIIVLLACFFLGGVGTHYLLAMLISETETQPHEAGQKPETSDMATAQANLTPFVSVTLPPPPSSPLRSTREPPLPTAAKRLASPELPASSDSELIDTRNEELIQQGLALLNHDQQNVPLIQISLPQAAQQREQVINTLRTCMGVTLGKVNQRGDVLAQEISGQPVSPLLRLVEGKLSQEEQSLANQWRGLSGSIVRFYPESADAKVLGGLLQLVQGSLADKKISGEYRNENGGLRLVNIQINGKSQQSILHLSEQC